MGIVAAYVAPHPPLIVPSVGRGQEHAIRNTLSAYQEIACRIAAHAPDVIVVVSPHAPLYRDCFHVSTGDGAHGDMGQFGAWDASLTVAYDASFAAAVSACARGRDVSICGSGMRDGELDHGTFVPLYFVNEKYADYRLVRVGLSGLPARDHREMGRCIAEAARDLDRRTVLVASGDLSHKLKEDGPYGLAPEGPVFDRNVTSLLDSGDLEGLFTFDGAFREAAAECGLGSLQVMAGALDGSAFTHELLSYEGPFGVGYAVAAFEVASSQGDGAVVSAVDREADARMARNEAASSASVDPFVKLARASVESFVRVGRLIDLPANLPPDLADARAGVFVSLHKDGDLRGCIGTIEPVTGSVAEEVIRNAVAAASNDPRFSPVSVDELGSLSYSVDVLFPPEPIEGLDELDVARFGVIVGKGSQRGLLLPNLDGVDSVEQQVDIAKRKAGISVDEGGVQLARFEVVRHERGGEARRA
ncbi:MAG: AmmeMemoRadiSam system protein A [Gordonibacter sp.]